MDLTVQLLTPNFSCYFTTLSQLSWNVYFPHIYKYLHADMCQLIIERLYLSGFIKLLFNKNICCLTLNYFSWKVITLQSQRDFVSSLELLSLSVLRFLSRLDVWVSQTQNSTISKLMYLQSYILRSLCGPEAWRLDPPAGLPLLPPLRTSLPWRLFYRTVGYFGLQPSSVFANTQIYVEPCLVPLETSSDWYQNILFGCFWDLSI